MDQLIVKFIIQTKGTLYTLLRVKKDDFSFGLRMKSRLFLRAESQLIYNNLKICPYHL